VAKRAAFKPKRASPPRPIVLGGHLHYEVGAVLSTRGAPAGPAEYHVTWAGYPASESSWIQELPPFFADVQDGDDTTSSCSSGSERSSGYDGGLDANKYAFGGDEGDEDSDAAPLHEGSCDYDAQECAPDYCPGAPGYFADSAQEGPADATGDWVAQLLDAYKSECDEYTFHTAYAFIHKQHRLARRMFAFRTLREQAKILASYANEDDDPTPECQQWNLQMESGGLPLLAGSQGAGSG